MAGLFAPKVPAPLPVVNPTDTANRMNNDLARRLQAGGTNADNTSAGAGMAGLAAVGGARAPTLTGIN